jgi:3-oxoadipate enol-lactonase
MRLFPSDDQVTIRKAFIQQILEGDENTYQQAMRSLAFVNLEKDLRQIRQPVLVISGAEDTTIPLVVQTKLAASISQAKHVIIPNAGHGVIVDQAERFNQVLLDFLTAA